MRRENDIGLIAAMAAGVALNFSSGYRRSGRRTDLSIDEVEEQWVRNRMHLLRLDRKAVARVVAELARATGPWAHRFGYGPHPGNREVARRLRQQARRHEKLKARRMLKK